MIVMYEPQNNKLEIKNFLFPLSLCPYILTKQPEVREFGLTSHYFTKA